MSDDAVQVLGNDRVCRRLDDGGECRERFVFMIEGVENLSSPVSTAPHDIGAQRPWRAAHLAGQTHVSRRIVGWQSSWIGFPVIRNRADFPARKPALIAVIAPGTLALSFTRCGKTASASGVSP
jgi:hypothetical protein